MPPVVFWLRWARLGTEQPHTAEIGKWPTVAECEREGWVVIGGDPRYSSVLMRKDES